MLRLAAVLACDSQTRTHDEVSAAQTKERTNASAHVDAGPLKLEVNISETAQLFHVVDQISQWSEFSHPQYLRYFELRGGGLSENDLRILTEHAAIRKRYGWGRGPEQVFYTPLDLGEALKAGVASGYLTESEADTEGRVFSYFRPRVKRLVSFVKPIPFYVIANPDDENMGGGYNAGNLTLGI